MRTQEDNKAIAIEELQAMVDAVCQPERERVELGGKSEAVKIMDKERRKIEKHRKSRR